MSQLYFGIVPYGTLCDVFIATLTSWSEDWIQTCTPDITEDGHLKFVGKHEQYVLDLSQGKPMEFRDQDYTDRFHEIEKVLEDAGNKKVWIGNFSSKQARLIKKYFKDKAKTIGISYNPSDRKIVLDNVLNYYEETSNVDKETKWINYHKKYYANKKKWNDMVPASFNPDTEETIYLSDFFVPDNFINFIETLDGPRNEKQLEYYFTWLYRTKERFNGSN